jgi:hypothetical protein
MYIFQWLSPVIFALLEPWLLSSYGNGIHTRSSAEDAETGAMWIVSVRVNERDGGAEVCEETPGVNANPSANDAASKIPTTATSLLRDIRRLRIRTQLALLNFHIGGSEILKTRRVASVL